MAAPHNYKSYLTRLLLCVVLLSLSACGQGAGDGSDVSPSSNEVAQDQAEAIILSDNYAGYLVVHLDESLGARFSASKALYTASEGASSDILTSIQDRINAGSGITLHRSVSMEPDKLDKLRARLEAQSGKKLADFNSIYLIEAPDPNNALQLYRDLKIKQGVSMVYAAPKLALPGIASVPDLTGKQGYLYPDSTTGGLNAQAAWQAGITGNNVQVVDMEGGWNYLHEDLSIDQNGFVFKVLICPLNSSDPNCQAAIAHGTSVIGIIASQDNGHGTTGFAPQAKIGLASIPHAATIGGSLLDLIDGDPSDGEMDPGAIFLIEVGVAGALGNCSNSNQYGCIPTTAFPANYAGVEYAIAAGITVVEGAANGSVSLDDPATYDSTEKNLSLNDVGSIIVGSSMGANHQKRVDTNFGNRVNVFAWGDKVVTTGYPYTGSPYIWQDTGSPKPPNNETNTYYTDMFGGTSAAAAMIAGASALVQSHAKQKLGEPTTRYLMPLKMREILVNSGVPQQGGGGNIGKQPRVDVAMTLVNTFVTQVLAQYPELSSATEQLTEAQTQSLRQLGVGIICRELEPDRSDPACPDEELWPIGKRISKDYDFDGDGRADLVKFENGKWYVDLSSQGSGGDNFGTWDMEFSFPPINGRWVWPYVADMNSDGRADFVAYDKEHGTFYVALTDTNMIRNKVWHGWDWILDYSSQWKDDLKMDPKQSNYSRPAIGNYNDDGYNDIAIVCSDGMVRVDYGAATEASFGNYEWIAQLIPDELLAKAPGWAYLPVPADINESGYTLFALKVPDGLPDEGRMYIIPEDGTKFYPEYDWMANTPHVYGGNDIVPMAGDFTVGQLGLKDMQGKWRLANGYDYTIEDVAPVDVYGDSQCHPVVADFDGDGSADRAVMCPGEWRIAYSSNTFATQEDANGVRHIPLGYEKCDFSLPGRSYSGGVSYQYTLQIIQWFKSAHPNEPPPILVDMVTACSQ